MTDYLLEIKNLCVQSHSNTEIILENISFGIKKGRITGIVGESGSGKSVSMLSVMRLLPKALKVTEGEIFFFEKKHKTDLLSLQEKDMNKRRGNMISMIFQDPMTSLNPSMKCGLQINELLKKHTNLNSTERKNKIYSLFKEVRLPNPTKIYSSYPHQLSGGQRQRVMIAMAVSADPSLLIADEPTTALDVTVQKNIINLLRQLQNDHDITIIFISHDLRLIKEIADDIIVMRNGRLIEINSKDALIQNPVDPYTKGLLACQPPPDQRPERLPTVEDFEQNLPPPKSERRIIRSANEEIIAIHDLYLHYNNPAGLFSVKRKPFRALQQVNLKIYKGETLGLVGESGCGKTSLGKTILLLIKNQSGDIFYRGKNIRSLNGKERKHFRSKVQIVFQDPYSSLNPRLNVKSTLNEVLNIHSPELSKRDKISRMIETLEKTGLNRSDLEKYPHEFSGGQRQRIGIARALIIKPELIILDESVSALDVSVQARILNLLNDLKDEFNLSYLFISHDLNVVRYMSDRIIVMKDGKIEETGYSDEVYKNPSSPYTSLLVNSLPGA